MNRKKYVLLLSGGLDSAVCLYMAKFKGYNIEALVFDYGQRHCREIKNAKKLASINGIKIHWIKFCFDWNAGSLVDRSADLPCRGMRAIGAGSVPSTFVPGRNLIFLSFGLSLALSIKARGVIIGANQVDFSGYPDCRDNFLRSFENTALLSGGIRKGAFEISAPLINMSKPQIVKKAVELKVPLELTWSCYKGGRKPCGMCDSCRIRE
ncbi:MAG TPA: 7-cyano-7-deazaguanine synthase QueC, partial [Firmicutes bacterium]|nr:7-cyano-7-deazaguanine synthase QueC [Bacillota bacterium]